MGTHTHTSGGSGGHEPPQRLTAAPPQAWRRYDTDRSGYIEANELKVGCRHGVGWAGSLPVGHPRWDSWGWGQPGMGTASKTLSSQGFLSDLLKKANRPYDEPKLQEYTQTIVSGTWGTVSPAGLTSPGGWRAGEEE